MVTRMASPPSEARLYEGTADRRLRLALVSQIRGLVFHVFGAIAEFERELIRERTQAGLAAARACGRTGGRPTVWTPEKIKTARAMRDRGEHDVSAISRVLGVSRASVYRALQQDQVRRPP